MTIEEELTSIRAKKERTLRIRKNFHTLQEVFLADQSMQLKIRKNNSGRESAKETIYEESESAERLGGG